MSRPECIDLIVPPDVLLELMLVPSGACQKIHMQNDSTEYMNRDEQIRIDCNFLLGKYPVTLAQWRAVMGEGDDSNENYSFLNVVFRSTPKQKWNCTPCVGVTGEQAVSFCENLSEIMNIRASLPREDEWEFACRCGEDAPFPIGEPSRFPSRYYGSLSVGYIEAGPLPRTIPSNRFGLFGMQAYIREWCYKSASGNNSTSDSPYTLCGSSRNSYYGLPMKPWYRGGIAPGGFDKAGGYGFRVKCDWPVLVDAGKRT